VDFLPVVGSSGPRRVSATGARIVVCSKPCATKYRREHGKWPAADAFKLAVPERACVRCKTPLSPKHPFDRCRVCRLAGCMTAYLRREAEKKAALQRAKDATNVYLNRGARPDEIVF
jgi:hypothetical protein